jgi:hypothetical protein
VKVKGHWVPGPRQKRFPGRHVGIQPRDKNAGGTSNIKDLGVVVRADALPVLFASRSGPSPNCLIPSDAFEEVNFDVPPSQQSNRLSIARIIVEEVTVHSEQNVYTEYADPKRSERITKIQPALKKAKLKALPKACRNELSRRELIELRAGRSRPHGKNQELLLTILKKLQLI